MSTTPVLMRFDIGVMHYTEQGEYVEPWLERIAWRQLAWVGLAPHPTKGFGIGLNILDSQFNLENYTLVSPTVEGDTDEEVLALFVAKLRKEPLVLRYVGIKQSRWATIFYNLISWTFPLNTPLWR